MVNLHRWFFAIIVLLICATGITNVVAQIETIGGFEGNLPSYWTKGVEPAGSTLEWAADQSRSMGHSLKISKSATSEAAVWESENAADFWSPQHLANVDIKVGAYIRTLNVNTNPANDNERWWVSYAFYDSSDVLIGETKLPIDQSVATSNGWVADTNGVGGTILPVDSWRTVMTFVGGKDATGTVWADDFMLYGRGGAWAGQNWNTAVGVPSGWIYWFPPIGGNDGQITHGFENTMVTSADAHSGLNSLKFDMPFNRETHDAFVGTKRIMLNMAGSDPVAAGDQLRISVWVKAANLVPDSAAAFPVTWAIGFTYGFWSGNGNNDGWNAISGYPVDMQFELPPVTSFDWTQYHLDITVPGDPATAAMSVRLHVYSRFTGTVYFDDLTVEKLDIPALNSAVGGFEGELPSYWTKSVEPGGSTLDWATDQSRSLGRSLKISKSATSEAAVWESENMADFWSPQHLANVDIKVGAYIKTLNVNTNPANDNERWWVSYAFYDSSDVLIGETKLPIDQTVATSNGWVADTNGVGATILPVDSWRTVISFVGGKDATGTVWADDFMLYGRSGAWAGQNWNTAVGVPSGWIYWLPPIGGNDGQITHGFENTMVTSAEAHSGLNSLKFDLPFNRETHDAFVGTKRFLFASAGAAMGAAGSNDISALNNVSPGDQLRVSVWVKAANLVPDSAAAFPVTWAIGFTHGFWTGNGNNDGWNALPGFPVDTQFELPPVTSFGWTQYHLDVTVPNDPATAAISVRLHIYSRFTGTVYFDDLTVEKLEIPALTSAVGGFEGDLPSYWTKGVEPAGSTLEWAADQSRSLGRSLKINKSATSEAAVWESENMADFWSPQHLANVDIKVGAYIRTLNVNTNPANVDEMWYVSYKFYDVNDILIGETKLPIDQSTATSNGWVADTNGVGATILPVDSWRTIISFVGGKDATGTVWADDFMLYGRSGAWAGQNWNTAVGVPSGWIYWLPPIGGNDGQITHGFENTMVTSAEAHSGLNSLKFDLPFNRETHDAFVGTKRFLFAGAGAAMGAAGSNDISALNNVEPGDQLRISVWVKAANLVPDSAAAYPVTWAIGFTHGFWTGNGNNDGWNAIAGFPVDMQFELPPVTAFGWTQYHLDVTVPDDPATAAISVRLHIYSRFTGTVYFDDLTVEKLNVTAVEGTDSQLPKSYALANNYPNPFNPSTTIGYALPRAGKVSVTVYNLLGQKIRTLFNGEQPAGRFEIVWNATDDFGNAVGSGLYFYRLETSETALVRKMILLK